MGFSLAGLGGVLKVGYRPAVSLGRFTFSQVDPTMGGGYRIDGTITAVDDYWLEQAEVVDITLDLRKSRWRFRQVPMAAVTVDRGANTVTVRTHQQPEDA